MIIVQCIVFSLSCLVLCGEMCEKKVKCQKKISRKSTTMTAIYSTNPKSQSARNGFEGNEDRLTMSELRLGRPREQDMGGSGYSEGRLKVLSLQDSEQEGS